jgi:nucleoid-associated protein YgaU
MRTPDGRLFDMAPATVAEDEAGPQRAEVAEKPQSPAAGTAAEPEAPVAVSATPPPPGNTVSGVATAAKRSGRPGVWIGVAVAVLVAIAVGLTQFLGGARDSGEVPVTESPVPDIEPEVEAPVIVVPGPEKDLDEDARAPVEVIDQGQLPTPVAPVAPTDIIDAAIVGLQRGDFRTVVRELHELVDSDPAALSIETLGPLHDELAQALAVAAEQAFLADDVRTGEEAFALLNHMAPFDPEMEALILSRLARYLETAEAEAAASSPGPKPVVPGGSADAIDESLRRLERSDVAGAARVLDPLLARGPDALLSERLGSRLTKLVESLSRAENDALARGDIESARIAGTLLERIGGGQLIQRSSDRVIVDCLLPGSHRMLGGSQIYVIPRKSVRIPANECEIRGGEFFVPRIGEKWLTYYIQRGDTLWGIAGSLTGDSRNWQQLVDENNRAYLAGLSTAFIENPNRIIPGQKLVVPTRWSVSASAIEYHVSRGESLWRIAERIYGDPLLWHQIYADNRATINDPDLIYPGQVLLLRPRADRR